jgi:hypothetical protein
MGISSLGASFAGFEFGHWPNCTDRITKRVLKIEKVVKTEHPCSAGM